MPRRWVRKTNRGVSAHVLKAASDEVRQGKTVRSIAKNYSICHVTLSRYCKKLQDLRQQGSRKRPSVGYRSSQKVFDEEQEEVLTDYLTEAADLFYGLTPREVRKFAYQLAVEYNIKHPQSWDKNSTAGPDWFSGFMKRHPNLSMRSAQPTSLARATSFNRKVKQALEEEDKNRKRKKRVNTDLFGKRQCKKNNIERKSAKKRTQKNDMDEDTSDEEDFCNVCMEPFSNSNPGEKWIKCFTCKLWAHENCTPGKPTYICHHCESDSD